jgi:thiol-disulfide isomerase/thioredoxin
LKNVLKTETEVKELLALYKFGWVDPLNYSGAHAPLNLICLVCKTPNTMTLHNLTQDKKTCRWCNPKNVPDKLSKLGFEVYGYTSLGEQFTIWCPVCKETSPVKWETLRKCLKCPSCRRLSASVEKAEKVEKRNSLKSEIQQKQIEKKKKFMENRGYSLITPETALCKKGHKYERPFSEIHSCPFCRDLPRNEASVAAEVAGLGRTLVEYSGSTRSPITVSCKNGSNYSAMLGDLRRQKECPCEKCQGKDIETLRAQAKSRGFEILSDQYFGFHNYHEFICGACNTCFRSSYDNFFSKGSGCPSCDSSKEEKEILNFLTRKGEQVLLHVRDKIAPQELDLLVPDKSLAVEHCGLYWHSERNKKDRFYHLLKLAACNEVGIRLLTIFSDEWLNRKNQIINFMSSLLGHNKKIHARNTKVVVGISNEEAKLFLEENHIQGSCTFTYSVGLYYENNLVGICTVRKHHRQNSKDWVLNRLCFASGITVVGGSSKLVKNIVKQLSDPTSLITFADRRWSEGGVYLKAGFFQEKVLPPDYSYCKQRYRKSKQSLRKKDTEKTSGLTEKVLRTQQGWYRIWDCGKIRFRYAGG